MGIRAFPCSGGRTRTYDLRVMSPTSYQYNPLIFNRLSTSQNADSKKLSKMSDNWKLTIGTTEGKKFVNLYINKTRYRYWNGKAIGVKVKSSENVDLLRSAFELKLLEGWRPEKKRALKKSRQKTPPTIISEIEKGVNTVLDGSYSYHHKRDVQWVFREFKCYLSDKALHHKGTTDLHPDVLKEFILQSKWSARTQKNVLTTMKCITNGTINEKLSSIKIRKVKSTLHKPIKDIQALLNAIKEFNDPLYICCLLTYGCLLRPHQEIRLLKWKDIDFERGIISLSGARNKSGRNRIVPIPLYIESELKKRFTSNEKYVLRDSTIPYSHDYLKVLWRRFKKQTDQLEEGVTLYSLRHSGSIQVFEKTGSLQKLQQVMGHSTMQVSLTYLRNLELKQLDVEDLPEL